MASVLLEVYSSLKAASVLSWNEWQLVTAIESTDGALRLLRCLASLQVIHSLNTFNDMPFSLCLGVA